MQYTKNIQINTWIDKIHELILKQYPKVVITEQPGFRAMNYGLNPGMKAVCCYIICYDQKANLGFPKGLEMKLKFPQLKGTGKMHRHVEITKALMKDLPTIHQLLKLAFEISV